MECHRPVSARHDEWARTASATERRASRASAVRDIVTTPRHPWRCDASRLRLSPRPPGSRARLPLKQEFRELAATVSGILLRASSFSPNAARAGRLSMRRSVLQSLHTMSYTPCQFLGLLSPHLVVKVCRTNSPSGGHVYLWSDSFKHLQSFHAHSREIVQRRDF